MTGTIIHVYDEVVEKAYTLHTATYIVACERTLIAHKSHDIYPG